MAEKNYKTNDVIFKQNAVGNSMYQIIDGTVGIYVNYGMADQNMLTELNKGQFFGEMAVIEAYPRSATAVALTDVKVQEISADDISEYFKSNPDRIIEIMQHIAGRLRDLTNDYTEVNATIKAITPGEDTSKRSTGLLDKIKKFANIYSRTKDVSKIESVESLKKINKVSHSAGYKDNVEEYKKGTILFKEGEIGECMYDIHCGKIGIFTGYGTEKEKCLTELHADEFFGEMGMIDNVKRSATAVVLEDGTVVETIYLNGMKNLFKENPPKVEMILAHLSYRLRKLTNEYNDACKVVFDIYNAENGGTVGDDLKKRVESYKNNL